MTVNHDGSQGVATPLPDDREIPSVARTKVNGDIKAMLNGTKNAQTNGINGTSHASKSKYWVPLNKQLAFTPRKIRVITIGAGYSGLIVAHKFQHKFPEMQDMVDHTIFEARSDVGGTWLVNTYPGVQCDVPAQIYVCTFSLPCCESETNLMYRLFHSTQIQIGAGSTRVGQTFRTTSRGLSKSGISIEISS